MTRRSRSLATLAAAPLVATGLLLSPGAAHADHDRHRSGHRHHDRHDRYEHHRAGHGYGKHHGPKAHHGHPGAVGYGYRLHRGHAGHGGHGHGYAARITYVCRPCGHSFHHRSHFHRHLSRHHHVPAGAFASVIVSFGLGWIYLG